jgi:hypothetical protein
MRIACDSCANRTLFERQTGTLLERHPQMDRPLTDAERKLIQWMLEHGKENAHDFLPQLKKALVSPWRCSCGCASIHLKIVDRQEPVGGMQLLADFIFGCDEKLSGIFVYEQDGILSGLEVYGLGGDAPTLLPSPESLREF